METAQLIIDTDVVIDYLRGRGSTLRDALQQVNCALTAVTIYELKSVPLLSDQQRALLEQLVARVDILAFDSSAAEFAAATWRSLAARGVLISLPDILSAGICLSNDLPLLTRNVDHFSRVEGLKVISPDELASYFQGG